jgi:hypothetical protein
MTNISRSVIEDVIADIFPVSTSSNMDAQISEKSGLSY